ncbi:MAG: NAD(P)H-hydrate dehydratase, partial [Lachnospiraceae bacterium]
FLQTEELTSGKRVPSANGFCPRECAAAGEDSAMRPVLSAAGMKETDHKTIEEAGIPSMVLMERAALAVTGCVMNYVTKQSRVGVLCGTGNNGGDGLAVARLLKEAGVSVTILLKDAELYREAASQQQTPGTPEFLQQLKTARAFGVPVCGIQETKAFDILVDALFGIGLSRTVEGAYAKLLEQINAERHIVIAVDIASGISADTGAVCGIALRATETVTFGAAKCGQLLYPGREYTGKLTVADIGFPKSFLWENRCGFSFVPEEIDRLLPVRPAYSNKGTFGKVVVAAGSRAMAGAAYFAAYAAYRMGAGLVKIATPECNREILQTKLPEAMLAVYEDDTDLSLFAKELVEFADALVIGPGLGCGSRAEELVNALGGALRERQKGKMPPSVWDADALNLLSRKMDSEACKTKEERRSFLERWLPEGAVLTPHLGELSRLTATPVWELAKGIRKEAEQLSRESKLVFVIKDAVTLVASKDELFINTTGNNGMATGGSGDALCGVIAALMAARKDPFSAAAAGVWLHGAAGDRAAVELGCASVMVRDILRAIGDIVAEAAEDEADGE